MKQRTMISIGIYKSIIEENQHCFPLISNYSFRYTGEKLGCKLLNRGPSFYDYVLAKVLLTPSVQHIQFDSVVFYKADFYGFSETGRSLMAYAASSAVNYSQSHLTITEDRFEKVAFSAPVELPSGQCFLFCDPYHFHHLDPFGIIRSLWSGGTVPILCSVAVLSFQLLSRVNNIQKMFSSRFLSSYNSFLKILRYGKPPPTNIPRSKFASIAMIVLVSPIFNYVIVQGYLGGTLIHSFITKRQFPFLNPSKIARELKRGRPIVVHSNSDSVYDSLFKKREYRPIATTIQSNYKLTKGHITEVMIPEHPNYKPGGIYYGDMIYIGGFMDRFKQAIDCMCEVLGENSFEHVGVAMAKDSPMQESISLAVLNAEAAGLFVHLAKRFRISTKSSLDTQEMLYHGLPPPSQSSAVTFEVFFWPFQIFFIALMSCFHVFLLERMVTKVVDRIVY